MTEAKKRMEEWIKHRSVLEKLLETIPDEHISYKPWDGAMALGEMAQHIAISTDMFVRMAKTGEGQVFRPNTENLAMEQLLDLVREYTEKTKTVYASITDHELELVYESPHPNLHGPRKKLIILANEHEIHHKGQLFLYARLVGVKKIPFFI